MARTITSQLVVELLDRVTGPSKAVGRSMKSMGKQIGDAVGNVPRMTDRVDAALARNRASLSSARLGIVDAVGSYYALKTAIGGPVKAASEFESAMADVRKVVDFPTPQGFAEFQAGLLDMSNRIPLAVTGLAEIAAAAGQAGIAGEDLNRFTEMAAKVGTAFDIGAGEAGDSLAKLMTGLGMSIDEVSSLSDAMNHLSNSQASSAAEILDVVRRVGATGKQYGFSAEQTSAFASAMISAGAESEVAATSFRNMGRALTMGAAATKSQRKAFGELGLDAERVSKRMQEDAVGTTIDVMERIAALPKHQQASISTLLFGGEARALGPLLTNLDLVRDSVEMVGDATDYAGSAQREYEVRSKTFANTSQLLNNRLTALKITLGNALIPVLTDLIDRISPILERMSDWISLHPQLTAGLFMATASLIAFKGALSALRFIGLLGQNGALSLLSFGLNTIGGTAARVAGAARASMALNAALAGMAGARAGGISQMGAALRGIAGVTGLGAVSTGISAAVAAIAGISAPAWLGIAAAVAAVGAAWRYWDRIKAIVSGVASVIGETLRPVLESVSGWLAPLDPVIRRFAEAWSLIDKGIRGAAETVRSLGAGMFSREILTDAETGAIKARAAELTSSIVAYFAALPAQMRAAGSAMITALGDGISEAWGAVKEKIEAIAASIASSVGRATQSSIVPGSVLDKARNAVTGRSPSAEGADALSAPRLKGGPVSRGSTRLVGEDGPELMTAGRSGYVHPNGTGGGGAGIGTVNFNPTINVSGSGDPESVARRVLARLKDEASMALRSAMADIEVS